MLSREDNELLTRTGPGTAMGALLRHYWMPVVVSDAGGLPETVLPGLSGMVFANGDVGQLADAVLELLDSEPRRATMARAARAWTLEKFSWDKIASQLELVYADALLAPGASS